MIKFQPLVQTPERWETGKEGATQVNFKVFQAVSLCWPPGNCSRITPAAREEGRAATAEGTKAPTPSLGRLSI